jgi:hypothetical protein
MTLSEVSLAGNTTPSLPTAPLNSYTLKSVNSSAAYLLSGHTHIVWFPFVVPFGLTKIEFPFVADSQPAFICDFHVFVAKLDKDVSALQLFSGHIYTGEGE